MLEKAQEYFFFGLMAVIAIAAFLLALPYLPAIIFAGALAVVFRPLYDRILRAFGGRRLLSTWGTLVLVAIIVFLPLSFLGYQVVKEAHTVYGRVDLHGFQDLPISQPLRDKLSGIAPSFAAGSNDLAQRALNWTLSSAEFFLGHLVTVIFNIFLCFIALFYLLADGDRLRLWIIRLSPLPEQYDQLILDRMTRTVTSVLRGTLVIALLQGVIAGIGFVLFGVPNPALWGSAAAVSALIPGVGTSLVLVPAVIYLFIFGSIGRGIGLAIWAILAIGLLDNILGPRLMRKGGNFHPFVIFIAVLGGLAYFGPLGFVIGPLVFSMLLALLDIYASLNVLEGKKNKS